MDERRWTLGYLVADVHLSPSGLSSAFVEICGKASLTYLAVLRAERLTKCLRKADF